MKRWNALLVAALAALILASAWPGASSAETMPRSALKYRADMIRTVRYVWGLNGPVAVMAAQVHQESAWNPTAKSRFASGLAQFTPDTADWIADAYPAELRDAQPFNPAWAMRALIRYDFHLHSRRDAPNPCDAWGFTLADYNGGSGWVNKERKLAEAAGANPFLWFGNVEKFNARAQWAFEENRQYPRRILLSLQPLYQGWGPGVDCARSDT